MAFYYSLYLVILILTVLSEVCSSGCGLSAAISLRGKNLRGYSVAFFCLAALFLIVVRGIRCGIGIDYFYTYVPKFNAALAGERVWGDALYSAFIQFCSLISSDYRVFFFLDSLVYIAVLFAGIYASGKKRPLVVALYLLGFHFVRSMNAQAQAMSMAFMLLAFVLLVYKGRRLAAVLAALVSIGIHSSSAALLLPMLVTVLVCRLKIDAKGLLRIVLIIPVCIICLLPLLPAIVEAALKSGFGGRYAWYFNSMYGSGDFSGYLFLVCLSLYLFMVFVLYQYKKNSKELVPASPPLVLASGIMVGSLGFTFLTGVVPVIFRVVYAYLFLGIVFIPELLDHVEKQGVRRALTVAIVLSFAAVDVFYLGPQDDDGAVPYVSVFSDASEIEEIESEITRIPNYVTSVE